MAFLVFEGLDGVGKSTLIKNFEKILIQKKILFLSTHEPGGTDLGEELKEFLLSKTKESPVPKAELLLYQAIRAQHVEKKIKPAFHDNQWILCDRYTASSIAFQVGGRGLSIEDVRWLNEYATSGCEPDLFIFLDLSIEKSFERASMRKAEKDRFEVESFDFFQRIRESYLDLVKETPQKWLVLDASQEPERLLEVLVEKLDQHGYFME